MKKATLKQILKEAQQKKYTIGQFNFSTLEQLKGIIGAAKKLKSPIILGTSEGESKFFGLEKAVDLVKKFRQETKLPIFLNLDHGKDLSYIKKAIKVGYDAVHFDGSELALKKNIEIVKKIVKLAKKKNVLVEGEVGFIPKAGEKIKEEYLTEPEETERFIKETKADSLAISIGNLHGKGIIHKNAKINLIRLKEIKNKIRETFLVFHGGSGTRDEDIKKAIKLGIVKININTELRTAFAQTLEKELKNKEIAPYKYLPQAIEAVQKVVENKIRIFGSINKI